MDKTIRCGCRMGKSFSQEVFIKQMRLAGKTVKIVKWKEKES